ncbi:MbtH family NRPS accessory protein [Streptomyces sp. MZ04]|uniref:MbtH family protein n=1 Tax=Streptomyces sp. MZ04 TaxID=2559236 RepID=UPI00107ECF0E|nr:MbtH family NRPS accessory protein [Streptomyces sp. MZ04]TGB14628.1 MbtH family NRPS accessory protein [Streptomyces sp. MZ04]
MRTIEYQVVVNQEDQYSIWPVSTEAPEGWSSTDFEGTRQECLAQIDRVWTDMRPLSVRNAMNSA